MLIVLKNPKIKNNNEWLPSGAYIVKRTIEGIGYLVYSKKYKRIEELTIIKFGEGVLIDE